MNESERDLHQHALDNIAEAQRLGYPNLTWEGMVRKHRALGPFSVSSGRRARAGTSTAASVWLGWAGST
jgi:hypothetical protein